MKMLTESTCKKSWANLSLCVGNTTETQVFKQLIKEHFEPHPYKFEDLKEEMWIWNEKKKEIIYLFKPLDWKPCKGIRYSYGKISSSVNGYYMDFEENRFFPITKALQYQEV